MKHLKPKKLLLAVALALGLASPALAQTIPDGYIAIDNYKEAFETASSTSSLSTYPLGWGRYTASGSMTYRVDNSGKTGKCIGHYAYSNIPETTFDYIVTPEVKGTVGFSFKLYSTSSSYQKSVRVYKLTKAGDNFTCNPEQDLIYEVPEDIFPTTASGAAAWVDVTIPTTFDNYTYLGFRLENTYIDDFTATSALVPIHKELTIGTTTLNGGSNQTSANADNKVHLVVDVTITNNSNVKLSKETEPGKDFSLSLVRYLRWENGGNVYEEPAIVKVDIPDLEPGASQVVRLEGDYDVPTDVAPGSSGDIGISIYVLDNFTPNFKSVSYLYIKPYKAIMNIRYDQWQSKTNSTTIDVNGKTIYFGAGKGELTRNVILSNGGPATMTVTGYESTNPDITVDADFPLNIVNGEPQKVPIKIGGAPGFKEGNVKFKFEGISILDNVDVAGDIVPENAFFADFEDLTNALNDWYAPSGSDSWSVGEYIDAERARTSSPANTYWPEYTINNGRLSNGRNNTPGHDLYSPKMSFEAGDKISFYAAKKTNYGNDVQLTVSYSPDRVNWTQLGKITPTNTGTETNAFPGVGQYSGASGQYIMKRFEFEMPEGEYYICLNSGWTQVDNFVGGTLVEVPYDIVSESAKAGGLKMVNNAITFEASFKNIGRDAIDAKNQNLTLYANDVAVAKTEAVEISKGQEILYNFSYIPHVEGETNLFAELAIGDYTVKSPIVTVKINPESSEIGNVIGDGETTATNIPFQFNWTHSGMETIYTTAQLSGMGLENKEITKIAFPYKKTNAHGASEVKIWIQNTDDTAVPSPAAFYADWSEEELYFNDPAYIVEACPDDFGELIFTLNKPFSYEDGKNIRVRIDLKCQKDGSSGNTAIATFKANKNVKDAASTRWSEDTFSGKYTPSRVTSQPQIILYTEQEVPTISGTVKDNEGEPIVGATVTVMSVPASDEATDEDNGPKAAPRKAAPNADAVYYQTTTDNEGTWSMTIFKPELSYVISVEADGYKASAPVALDLNDPDNNDFILAVEQRLSFEAVEMSVLKGSDATVTKEVAINLSVEDEMAYQGFQFNVTLPAGVEITTVAAPIAEEPTCMQIDADTNTYKVLAYGSAGTANTEAIATLTLSTKYDATAEYPIEGNIVISDVIFSTPTGKDIEDITGYTGSLIITLEEVKANEILIEDITVMEPSYSSADDVTVVTAGENISASVSLMPEDTTDSVEDIEWTVTGAEGITVTVDEEGNMEINTENAEFDGKQATVTITGTVGDITVTKTITVKEVLLGDANANGVVTVSDVVTTAKVAVAKTAAAADVTAFSFPNANVDDTLVDGKQGINAQDITGIVNIVLKKNESGARTVKRTASVFETNDRLVVDNFHAIPDQETIINVRLDNSYNYAALQASVIVPEGMKVISVTKGARAANHDIVYHIGDGNVGVMIYSLSNASFIESDDVLFQLHVVAEENCDDLSFENINAADASSNGYLLGFDGGMNETGTTGIDGINADDDVRYFDINGIEFKADMLQPGIYIRVKGDKAEKIVIR